MLALPMCVKSVLVRPMDFALDVANWDIEKLNEICLAFSGNSLADYLNDHFEDIEPDDLVINKA
jgi:hypothetical protein